MVKSIKLPPLMIISISVQRLCHLIYDTPYIDPASPGSTHLSISKCVKEKPESNCWNPIPATVPPNYANENTHSFWNPKKTPNASTNEPGSNPTKNAYSISNNTLMPKSNADAELLSAEETWPDTVLLLFI